MENWKEKRRAHGEREKNQARLFMEYQRQERKKAGVVNYDDHWHEFDQTIQRWLNSPRIKEKGKRSLIKIWFLAFRIYNELSDMHIEKKLAPAREMYNLAFFNPILIGLEKRVKEWKQKFYDRNMEFHEMKKKIEQLENSNKALKSELEYYQTELNEKEEELEHYKGS